MSIGIWQILLIVLIIVLLFGAGKLPRLMGDFAKGMKAFKTGLKDGPDAEQPQSQSQRTEAPNKVNEQKTASADTAESSEKKETVQR